MEEWIKQKIKEFNKMAKYDSGGDDPMFKYLQDQQDVEDFIRESLESAYQQGSQEGTKKLADKIVDNIDEFGEDPKQALACVSETIDMWFITPEQQREYNEGHDY